MERKTGLTTCPGSYCLDVRCSSDILNGISRIAQRPESAPTNGIRHRSSWRGISSWMTVTAKSSTLIVVITPAWGLLFSSTWLVRSTSIRLRSTAWLERNERKRPVVPYSTRILNESVAGGNAKQIRTGCPSGNVFELICCHSEPRIRIRTFHQGFEII